jgi:hypothetical protein
MVSVLKLLETLPSWNLVDWLTKKKSLVLEMNHVTNNKCPTEYFTRAVKRLDWVLVPI